MAFSLYISANLHDDKKSCTLTYTDPTDLSSQITCTTDLPKLVAIALEAPYQHTKELGAALYQLLDGDGRHLAQARERARHAGEKLLLRLQLDAALQDLPFELLHDGYFLLTREIHLVRQISDRGRERDLTPAERPLKLLFMACSPIGLEPELDFEKEEDAIYRATDKLPIEIDVEDSGSLEGLAERLTTEEFDIIHISGHAALDRSGKPIFWMEDDEGQPQAVDAPALAKVLRLKPPRVLFLSGCRTGEADPDSAIGSFAQQMVDEKIPFVLSWGRSVSDLGATAAAKQLYFELSRGQDLASAVLACRQVLSEAPHEALQSVWPLLRLFADETPFVEIVKGDQKFKPTPRKLTHAYLANSEVKILHEGFVGRRRQIQDGLRVLRHGQDDPASPDAKVGIILHGTAGLGKSCLAGKIIERLSDEKTGCVVVKGRLDATTIEPALQKAFLSVKDEAAQAILAQKKEMPDKLYELCVGPWQQRRYLILLDDFEQNFVYETKDGRSVPVFREGQPVLEPTAAAVLQALLRYLPETIGMVSLVITSRYLFSLHENDVDLVATRLQEIGLTTFRKTEQRKKVAELPNLLNYPQLDVRDDLIAAGHGNPRLMERIDKLVGEKKAEDIPALRAAVLDQQEEYVHEFILEELLATQPPEFRATLRRASVFRIPVQEKGMLAVCDLPLNTDHWSLDTGVSLSLVEHDDRPNTYWITPLLREKLFVELSAVEQFSCHQAASQYYRETLKRDALSYFVEAEELVYHALNANEADLACDEGAGLVGRLRENLAYAESKRVGEWLLASLTEVPETENGARLLVEVGYTINELGDNRRAIGHYERSLTICKKVFGEEHQEVAIRLNNLGGAWSNLGEKQKAIAYIEQALTIDRKVFGDEHPDVATRLNNLGVTWKELGKYQKAIEYCEQALTIYRKVFGDEHPMVAIALNNLGAAWKELGEHQKAIDYSEQALTIDRKVFGDEHPKVAIALNNLGGAWSDLGEKQKAIAYLEQALAIDRKVFGDEHPNVARALNDLGMAWSDLGENKKTIDYFEQALVVFKKVFGEEHPNVATLINNLGAAWLALGEKQKAIDYFGQALAIDRKVFGDEHPNVAIRLNNLGGAWSALGEKQKAIDYYEQVLAIDRKVFGNEHPKVATSLIYLGAAWSALGENKKAIDNFEQALTIDRKVFGDEHPNVARDLNNLGVTWSNLGENKKAIDYFEQAYEIFLKFYGPEHPHTQQVLSRLRDLG